MTNSDILMFGSGMKEAFRILSNLHESRIVAPNGVVYPSSEHMWQSQKAKTKAAEDYIVSLDELTPEAFQKILRLTTEKSEKNRLDKVPKFYSGKASYWSARGCVGILAKLASNRKYRHNTGLSEHTYDFDKSKEMSEEEILEAWTHILMLKFTQNEVAREVLLSTGSSTLLEFDRQAVRSGNSFWGGAIDKKTGLIVGRNAMGKLLMKVRSAIGFAVVSQASEQVKK